jgi:hypothetical protein
MAKRIIYLLAIMLAATACIDNTLDQVLLVREDISLSIREQVLMSFDENTCQLGYNSARNEYRVYQDFSFRVLVIRLKLLLSFQRNKLTATPNFYTHANLKLPHDEFLLLLLSESMLMQQLQLRLPTMF